jgi:predicted transposase YdaD
MISRTPDQRRHYDARLKWELDENTRIQTAFEEGEARGEARVRIELIQTLEGLLRLPISSEAELQGLSIEELKHRAEFLQNTIRNRSSS